MITTLLVPALLAATGGVILYFAARFPLENRARCGMAAVWAICTGLMVHRWFGHVHPSMAHDWRLAYPFILIVSSVGAGLVGWEQRLHQSRGYANPR